MKRRKGLWLLLSVTICLSFAFAGCSKEKSETIGLEKVKDELKSYSFNEHKNLAFRCEIPTVKANEVYTITMNMAVPDKTSEEDRAKLKKAVNSVYGIDVPIEKITDFQKQGNDDSHDSLKQKFEFDGYGGEVYNGQSTFMIWKPLPSSVTINLAFNDAQRYTAAAYPKEEFKMADGSTLTVDKAIEQAKVYIDKLNACKMFDENESQILTNIMVADTENGKVIVLHYRQVRFDIEVDDGGALTFDKEVDQMRNPFFEILFAGDDFPFNIRNMYSDGVKEKKAVDIIPLSKAEQIISDSIAPNTSYNVYDAALRYCCVYQQQDDNREYRPMWCFVLSDQCKGENGNWSQYFPRITAYVDAVNCDVYYCDSQKYVLEKMSSK